MTEERFQGLDLLGKSSGLPASPDDAIIEKVDNSSRVVMYVVRIPEQGVAPYRGRG